MFIRNAWYVGAWDHEVGRQNLLRRTLLDDPVVFYRREDGTPVALEDRCCHRHMPLSKGRLIGDDIQWAIRRSPTPTSSRTSIGWRIPTGAPAARGST